MATAGLEEQLGALLERLNLGKYREVMEENEVSGFGSEKAETCVMKIQRNRNVTGRLFSLGRYAMGGEGWGGAPCDSEGWAMGRVGFSCQRVWVVAGAPAACRWMPLAAGTAATAAAPRSRRMGACAAAATPTRDTALRLC